METIDEIRNKYIIINLKNNDKIDKFKSLQSEINKINSIKNTIKNNHIKDSELNRLKTAIYDLLKIIE
jgi:hypothetical protein